MIDIENWIDGFLCALNDAFTSRIWFVGLQGSYGRGEATDESDIDVVVILDELSTADIQSYGIVLDTLPHREKICGFLSGKEEIMNWDASDLFQFINDTIPIKGKLDELFAFVDESAVNRAIKTGACNIYHGCIHNMLHEKRDDILRGLYKSASFVVQAILFKQTGRYFKHKKELLSVAFPDEQNIVNVFLELNGGATVDFLKMSEKLLEWSKRWILEGNDKK